MNKLGFFGSVFNFIAKDLLILMNAELTEKTDPLSLFLFKLFVRSLFSHESVRVLKDE
jgi:hypothetical protein